MTCSQCKRIGTPDIYGLPHGWFSHAANGGHVIFCSHDCYANGISRVSAKKIDQLERKVADMAKTQEQLTADVQSLASDVQTLLTRFAAFIQSTAQQIADLKSQIANGQPADFSALDQSVADIDTAVKGFNVPAASDSSSPPPPASAAPDSTPAAADATAATTADSPTAGA